MCGLMPLEEFYDRYQEASGLAIDRKRLHYYEVVNRYQQLQTVLGTAYRVVRLSKSHQNIVIARLQKAAYLLAEDLRQTLEGVI
jgi:aminoglycoside phosphotransferase (APT) family kinase protein